MVQNSLGRLWMLNNPASPLRAEMEYYIEPDSEHEDFIEINGPEDISLCDPACGSGHILVYAFELLSKMYLERGYREREIPGLVLSKNLHGMEIDPRAAQIARLALAMCARGMDRRFFGRGVQADIAVLAPVALGEGDVPQGSALAKKKDLVDALAHLDEAGSLLAPGEADLAAIREAIDLTGDGGLFGGSSRERLQRALSTCETLARRHDCVVANPPYMGSSSFGPFMSRWVKRNYPDVKSDLCTCFIERGFGLARDRGYAAMVTMQSWMFLGSFEKMRSSLIDAKAIVSMAHLGPRAFDAIGGEVVNVTADVVYNGRAACEGAYVRLVDINGGEAKRLKLLEAIGNPDCGWFYRREAETFKQIPGTPIAYWASDAMLGLFANNPQISDVAFPKQGSTLGNNELFLRRWYEVSNGSSRWFPCMKGGVFRRWYGNQSYVVDWADDGKNVRNLGRATIRNKEYLFRRGLTWSNISSSLAAFRLMPEGFFFESSGTALFAASEMQLTYLLGYLNSSISKEINGMVNPTLHFQSGDIGKQPYIEQSHNPAIQILVKKCIADSIADYDTFEASWDFRRHPLV